MARAAVEREFRDFLTVSRASHFDRLPRECFLSEGCGAVGVAVGSSEYSGYAGMPCSWSRAGRADRGRAARARKSETRAETA